MLEEELKVLVLVVVDAFENHLGRRVHRFADGPGDYGDLALAAPA